MEKTALKLLVSIVFWCFLTPAHALSLSEVELKSFLNQPLEARVSLGNVAPGELEQLQASLLPSADDEPGSRVALSAEIAGDEANGYYILIRSRQAIREPILTFTLEVVWTGGRIQREYSLLLDPMN